ncbi:MAG: hypothetical protein AAB368_03885, partial [bacterium]
RASGARPLKRKIQEVITNPLSLRLLKGEFAEGDGVVVDHAEGGYVIAKVVTGATARERTATP